MTYQHTIGDWSVYLDEAADAPYYFNHKSKITTWIRPDELGGPESETDEEERGEDEAPPPPPPEDDASPPVAIKAVVSGKPASPPKRGARRLSALEALNNPSIQPTFAPVKSVPPTKPAPALPPAEAAKRKSLIKPVPTADARTTDQKAKEERQQAVISALKDKVEEVKTKRLSLSARVLGVGADKDKETKEAKGEAKETKEAKEKPGGRSMSSLGSLLEGMDIGKRSPSPSPSPPSSSPASPTSSISPTNLSTKGLDTLAEIFSDPIALDYFTKFAQQQRCSENILFWQKAEEYLKYSSGTNSERQERASILFKNFLKSGAPFEINCNQDEVQRIEKCIAEASGDLVTVFVPIQNQIFLELQKATFANFKKSPLYAQAQAALAQAPSSPVLVQDGIVKVVAGGEPVKAAPWQGTCLGPGLCPRGAVKNPDPKSIFNKSDYCLKHQYLSTMEPWKIDLTLEGAHRVAVELMTSEGSYREGLRSAFQGFYMHLKIRLEIGRPKLSKNGIARVFMNLEKLYQLSCALHEDLQEVHSERALVQQLTAIMLYYAPAFNIYRPYLEGYDDSIHKLNRERTKNEKFNLWISVHEKVEGSQLPSLLIMPVQRLPRYVLLLKEFKKFVPESSNLHYDLDSVISRLTETIQAINAALFLRDQLRKLQDIEDQFDKAESDFIPFAEKPETRYLILRGDLMRPEMVRRRKSIFSSKETDQTNLLKFHFFLFTDLLIYAIGQGTRLSKYKMRGYMNLADLTVEKDTLFDDNQINVNDAKGKRFKIKADDTAGRDMWFAAMSTAIQAVLEGAGAAPREIPAVILGKAL